jgi:hypothetical protein
MSMFATICFAALPEILRNNYVSLDTTKAAPIKTMIGAAFVSIDRLGVELCQCVTWSSPTLTYNSVICNTLFMLDTRIVLARSSGVKRYWAERT